MGEKAWVVYTHHGELGDCWRDGCEAELGGLEEWEERFYFPETGRDSVVALEYSRERAIELGKLGYREMELDEFREAVEKWCGCMSGLRRWRKKRREFRANPFWQKVAGLLGWEKK